MITEQEAIKFFENCIGDFKCWWRGFEPKHAKIALSALEEQMNNSWVSCDDRLPKSILSRDIFNRPTGYYTNPVLVTVESKECDGVHRYVSTDMMRGQTEDSMEWIMSCGYGGSAVYSQKTIAWKPLPEVYKDGENE